MKLLTTLAAVAAFAASSQGGPGCGGGASQAAAEGKQDRCGAASEAAYTTVRASYDRHQHGGSGSTIVDIAAGDDRFETLVAAVQAAGLAEALSGEGPFTVFAPTDAAFEKLPEGTVETLLKPENRDTLRQILTFHVVSGEVTADRVVKLREAGTLQGQRVDISLRKGRDGQVRGVQVNGADVTATDIRASNGVIHVIDEVMMPERDTIVEVADGAGSFTTLLAAAKAAGLAETLSTQGPLTVLAPTDEAFEKLPRGTVERLLRPENRDQLRQVLLYHVIDGRVYDDQAAKLSEAGTLQGGSVSIGIVDGRLMIDDAAVVKSDIEASNGVVHVIDTVLIPE